MSSPEPVASAPESAAPASDPTLDHLDDVMAQAEIAANAQRDLEAEDPSDGSSGSSRPESSEPADEVLEDDDGDEAAGAAAAPDGEQPEQPTPQETAPEQPAEPTRLTRRNAEKIREERDQVRVELEQTRNAAQQHQAELSAHRDADQRVLHQLSEYSGYVKEQNGRFRYENLRDKLLTGQATAAEQQEVTEMTQWHEFAGPIYRAAEIQVASAFVKDWSALANLDGIGPEGLAKLNKAPSGVDASRTMHALAYEAGQKKARAEAAAEIARLKAETKGLKTQKVARSPQPAVSNGMAVAANGGFLSRALDSRTGLSSDDFDREVDAGKWLGADLANS